MLRTTPRPSPSPSTSLGLVAALSLLATSGCHGGGSGDGDGGDGTDSASGGTAGTADTTAGSGDDGDTGADTGDGVDIEPAPGGIRRLITREYLTTIEMLLGPEAAEAADPPVDTAQDGFQAVGASLLALDAVAVEQYETSAGLIADAAIANPLRLAETVPCVMGAPSAACYEDVARDFGRLAFRRPLDADEIDLLVEVAEHGQSWGEGDFEVGLRYQLTAILQMPSFLYLVELGEPDEQSGYRRLNPYELATRMSIFLLGHGPSAEMLDLAESGGLDDNTKIRAQAQSLIGGVEARSALAGFFDEYLRLEDLENTAKNPELFPDYSADLARSMRQESQLLVHDIVWERDADYRELFTADYTFVNDRLAALYGMTPPDQPGIYERAEWPADQHRAGYLSQASFLTHQSSSLRNSPTKRGRFVQQSVLCTDIPPPPPGVVPTLPDLPGDITLRELLLMHLEEPSCATCHAATDPVGFAFEYFDAIGAYRTSEPNGLPVTAQGEIADFGSWENAAELAEVVAADPRTSACVVKNLIRGSLGHRETSGEGDAIAALDQTFGENGYSVQTLLVEFPTSPLFQLVDEPK